MIELFKRYFVIGIIGLTVVFCVVDYIVLRVQIHNRDAKIAELNNKVAVADSLRHYTKTVVGKLAVVESSDKSIIEELETQNAELAGIVKKQDGKIRVLSKLTLAPAPTHIESAAQETVYVQSGIKTTRVDFDKKIGRIGVKGYTVTPPPYVSLDVTEDPISLTILLTEQRRGVWQALVECPVDIMQLNTQVVPYRASFLSRCGLRLGLGFGKSAIGLVGLNCGNYELFTTSDSKSLFVGVSKVWKFRKE